MRDEGEAEFIHKSEAWTSMDVRVCYLDEQFRHEDASLEKILNEMRGGSVSPQTRQKLQNMCEEKRTHSIIPTRLYTHNADVDAENGIELAKLPGTEHAYEMSAKGKASIVESLKKAFLHPRRFV